MSAVHEHQGAATQAPAPAPRPGRKGRPPRPSPVARPTPRAGRGTAGRQARPLGTSPTVRPEVTRYALRRWLQGHLPRAEHRVSVCGRHVAPQGSVSVRRAPGGGAHFAGLQVCGAISVCPVCGPKIRHGRAAEISRAAELHQAAGGHLVFVTLTTPHDRGDTLEGCWDLLRRAFRELVSGRARAELRDRFGVHGYIRATEATHGTHGWHVHAHLLLFVDTAYGLEDTAELWRWLHQRWARRVEAHGGRRPSLARGVQVIPCRDDNGALGTYLAKVASEVTRQDGKTARASGSRTPMQLLADAAEGDAQAWAIFREWIQGSRGRRIVEWSRGLRAALGVTERTDNDLVAEVDHAETVLEVTREAWRELLASGADVQVLQVMALADSSALAFCLDRWSLPLWIHTRTAGPPILRTARARVGTARVAEWAS